jgi:2-iminobutanoate/2-iminopropanoate deaminase
MELDVYTTEMYNLGIVLMCSEAQIELWDEDASRYLPRTIVEIDRLNDDDVIEVGGNFLQSCERAREEDWGRWVDVRLDTFR